MYTDVTELQLVVVLDDTVHGIEGGEGGGGAASFCALFLDARVRVATQGAAGERVGSKVMCARAVAIGACSSNRIKINVSACVYM